MYLCVIHNLSIFIVHTAYGFQTLFNPIVTLIKRKNHSIPASSGNKSGKLVCEDVHFDGNSPPQCDDTKKKKIYIYIKCVLITWLNNLRYD